MTETVTLVGIRRNGGTQVRAQTDWLIVDDYAQAMKDGATFPPIVVYFDGAKYWLSDGFHRVEAAERAGLTEIAADVRRGTQRDAVLNACSANAAHGLRRTNADKRRAVETLLRDEEWRKWSDSEIARRCAVGHAFVSQLRNSIFPQKKDERLVTRGGTTYTQNTANIGSKPPVYPLAKPFELDRIVESVMRNNWDLATMNLDDVAEMRKAYNTPGSIFRRDVEAEIAKAKLSFKEETLLESFRNVIGFRAQLIRDYGELQPKPSVVPAPVAAGPQLQWVGGEPKPYPKGDILPNGHPTHYVPARLERVEVAPPDPEPAPAPEPLPAPVSRVTIINADAQQVGEMVNDPVHLVVTSPPYNVGIDYDQHNDNLLTYLPLLGNVWRGCHRVMADGARIAVVVPFGVGRNPYTPFDCQIMQTLVDAGFTLRGRIIWDKNTTGNRTSWGSYRLPSSPSIRDTTECIIVAHKGGDALEIPAEHKQRDEKGTHTAWLADGDYFMGLAQDHWVVSPESAQRVKHPAPYPVELVTRLIHFYAFPGAHILDPFGGSGTTAIAAKRLGCDATLIELSAEYCQLARERIDGN